MSNYTKTTNFLRKDSLPDTDTDKIIRGSEFDTEFNNLVTAVASKANTVSPELTGVPRAPTAATGTSSTQLATTAFVAQNAILRGMIVMWSGAVSTIPTGYALCNGANGTPDLRNRFIMGAGSTYSPGNTGGSPDAVAISHTHTASTSVSTSTGLNGWWDFKNRGGTSYATPILANSSGGKFTHTNRSNSGSYGEGYKGEGGSGSSRANINVNHNHTGSTTVNAAGVAGTGKNNPAYYALAFIMKT